MKLVWEQLDSTPENPTPSPINVRVVLADLSPASEVGSAGKVTPQDGAPCTLVQVNVYLSEQTPVQTVASNLWRSVPPTQTVATLAARPVGTFYVLTNVWNCNGELIESGKSNEASVPPGPEVIKVSAGSKIKAIGSGFSDVVEVLIGEVGFAKNAKVSERATVIQNGRLKDGKSLSEILLPGKSVLINFRNSNGGIGSYLFTKE